LSPGGRPHMQACEHVAWAMPLCCSVPSHAQRGCAAHQDPVAVCEQRWHAMCLCLSTHFLHEATNGMSSDACMMATLPHGSRLAAACCCMMGASVCAHALRPVHAWPHWWRRSSCWRSSVLPPPTCSSLQPVPPPNPRTISSRASHAGSQLSHGPCSASTAAASSEGRSTISE
jgi:hypothetical protein